MLKILSLALIATGVLHNTLALLTMREALRRIRDGGIFNSVHSGDAQTFAFLWFIVAGFALMLIGLTFWQLADANRLGWSPILACSHSPLASPCSFPKPARYCCSPLRSPLSSPNAAARWRMGSPLRALCGQQPDGSCGFARVMETALLRHGLRFSVSVCSKYASPAAGFALRGRGMSQLSTVPSSLDKMLESRRRKARWTGGAIGAPNAPAVFRHFLCLPTQVNATAAPRCYNRAVSSHPPSP